ncbi:hypothetical protein ACEPAF_150 [Sanghuangporus sanghuang]
MSTAMTSPRPLEEMTMEIVQRLRSRNIPEFQKQNLEQGQPYGAGGYGSRAIVHWKRLGNGELVAVKCLSRTLEEFIKNADGKDAEARKERLFQYFERECALWHSGSKKSEDPRCSNIVRLLGFTTGYESRIFPSLVLELYPEGDFREFVSSNRQLNEKLKLKLLCDVASGLAYLHEPHLMIVHRDINGRNIMVRRHPGGMFSAAIGDFGSAKLTDPEAFPIINSSTSPSLAWTPPEYFVNGKENYSNPTIFGDVWSFACTVIEIMSDSDPWTGIHDYPLCLAREKQPLHPPVPERYKDDSEFRSFARSCFFPTPDSRPVGRLLEERLQIWYERI